jgi:hypothetical protein
MTPFWIVTDPYARAFVAPSDQNYVAGFRSLHNAKAFHPPHDDRGVGFKLVCDPRELRALKRQGLEGVCFEPGHDRKEKKVPFDELDPAG